MKAVNKSNIGAKRLVNQDTVLSTTGKVGSLDNLFIVADGMGGHAGGAQASAEAVRCVYDQAKQETDLPIGEFLIELAKAANEHVYELGCSDPQLNGMGTTLVVATVHDRFIYCVNVGDSRLYIVNNENRLQRVTEDHSLVEQLIRSGQLTDEEARQHPQRNLITRAIGTEPYVAIDLYKVPVSSAKKLLLCSDGLSSQITQFRMDELINHKSASLDKIAQLLVNEANRNGGNDNISLILVDLEKEAQ